MTPEGSIRKACWGFALLLLGLLAAVAPQASAQSDSCGSPAPTKNYSSTAMTAVLAVPLSPCRTGRHSVTMRLTLSFQRCVPITGCTTPAKASRICRGSDGSCVLSLRVSHPAVEVANYYLKSELAATSGDDGRWVSRYSSDSVPCASAAAVAQGC